MSYIRCHLSLAFVPSRLYSNQITFEVRKYQPQTKEIKDVVQALVSAGIPNHMFDKYRHFMEKKVKHNPSSIECARIQYSSPKLF